MSSSGDNNSINWKGWVMGIAATVVGALLIAILTPLVTGNEETPTPTPVNSFPLYIPTSSRQADIKILNLPRVTLASTSEDKILEVEVLNEGNIAAESCQIQVNDEAGNRLTNSNFFGLVAGETETVDVILEPFDSSLETQAITISVQVICANVESPIYKIVLSILP